MGTEGCDTCKFYSALKRCCRKNPPAVFMGQGPGGQPMFIGGYPPVGPTDWCGAYEVSLETTNSGGWRGSRELTRSK